MLFCFAKKPREGVGCRISLLGVIHKRTFSIFLSFLTSFLVFFLRPLYVSLLLIAFLPLSTGRPIMHGVLFEN